MSGHHLSNSSFEAGSGSIIEDSLDPRPHFNLDNLERQKFISLTEESPSDVTRSESLMLPPTSSKDLSPNLIADPDGPDEETEGSLASFVRKEKELEMDTSSSSSSDESLPQEEVEEQERERERDRKEKERTEKEMEERERLEREENEKIQREQRARMEQESEREKKEQTEKEIKEREREERARMEEEERLERERIEMEESLEKERIENGKTELEEREREQQLEKEKMEMERVEREKLEREMLDKEQQMEKERIKRQEEEQRFERERLERERLEVEREKEKEIEALDNAQMISIEDHHFRRPSPSELNPDSYLISADDSSMDHHCSTLHLEHVSGSRSSTRTAGSRSSPDYPAPLQILSALRTREPRPASESPTPLTASINLDDIQDRARSCSPNSSSIPVRDIAKMFEPTTGKLKSASVWKSMPNLNKSFTSQDTRGLDPRAACSRVTPPVTIASKIPVDEEEACTKVPIRERKRIFEEFVPKEKKTRYQLNAFKRNLTSAAAICSEITV